MEDIPTSKLRNIYIVGAQSTGKTTLVRALEAHISSCVNEMAIEERHEPPDIIKEVARGVMATHKLSTESIFASQAGALHLQNLILQAQHEAEAASRWFISDRSGLDPVVYARMYVDAAAADQLEALEIWKQMRDNMRRALVVINEPNLEWLKDDGTRKMPVDRDDWIAFHNLFCDRLITAGIRYHMIPATMVDINARVALVMRWWSEGS